MITVADPGDESPSNHTGSEMLLRWLQFGAFSPIFRTHCEPSCDRYIWDYTDRESLAPYVPMPRACVWCPLGQRFSATFSATFVHECVHCHPPADFDQMRAVMRLRDALVPYIYTAAVEAYRSGVSLLRPMYYAWPGDEAAYEHPGQYMFGEAILVSPVSSAGSNITGRANKAVYLPRFPPTSSSSAALSSAAAAAADSCWLNFADGQPASESKDEWQSHEIPAFVRVECQQSGGQSAGAIIPMRTMNSTYSSFADPLIWATWSHTYGEGRAVSYSMYEDAGDGIEYEASIRGGSWAQAHATTRATLSATTLSGSNHSSGQATIAFEIEPAVGTYPGQRATRQQLVQFRAHHTQPTSVTVDGRRVEQITEAAAYDEGRSGWFMAGQSEGGRDNFTRPAGGLVVAVGRGSTFRKRYCVATFG